MYVITRNQAGIPVITDCNELFLRTSGYSRTEVLERPLADFYTADSRAALSEGGYQQALTGYFVAQERQLLTREGRVVETLLQAMPETDAAGRVIGTRAMYVDITERKQAEADLVAKNEEIRAMTQQLWQTAKLATMGELAASIAHELNNPLGTVGLRVESLSAQVPPGDPIQRELKVIEQEVDRMGTLVANLLQFSRRGTQQISSVDVRQEIGRTLELIHYHLRQRQVAVVREFAPDVPMVQVDRQQLRQLLLNLFTNAADAMPEGGTLRLRVSAVEKQVLIEIADTGVGIAPEDLPKVMEPFFTTKPEGKGTGLGLAICRRVAQEHGGTLAIASAGRGQGVTVRVTLPIQNKTNGNALTTA